MRRRHIGARLAVLIVVFVSVLASVGPALAADPFQSGRPAAALSPVTAAPSWLAAAIAGVARAQSELNDAISEHLRHLSQTHSLRDLAVVLALSFTFGVFHAVGPGHGKMVVASYLMARRERLASGIVVGSLISLVQGLSAIAAVGLLALVLKVSQLALLDRTTPVELVSYGLIILIGLAMLYQAVTGRGHRHAHGPDDHDHAQHDHAQHDHAQHDHAQHDHAQHDHAQHDHAHHSALPHSGPRRGMIGLALAAGLVPCASAVIVMLFALANHVFVIGVEAALAMSLGMAITVSTVGLAAIVARQLLQRTVSGSARGSIALERGLNVAGSLVLVVFASLLMAGAWARL